MNTSRFEGRLVLHTNKPYKIARQSSEGGSNSDATEIICKEITFAVENAANDLEQMFKSAVTNWGLSHPSIDNKAQPDTSGEDAKNSAYEANDSPSEKEVENQAAGLENMFMLNTDFMISDLSKKFNEFVNAGLVMAENETKISTTHPIWISIDIKDKRRILFSYLSFFVKPLSSLINLSQTKLENTSKSGVIEG